VIELGLLALAELVVRTRRRRPDALVPIALGAATGVALTVGWVAWAHGGSVRSLIDQAGYRTSGGADRVTPNVLVSYLRWYWVDTFTPWQLVLALPVLLAAWLEPRTRPVLAVSLFTVVLWIGVFSDGAAHHDYWGYWLVLPLAIGLAVAAEVVLSRASRRATLGILAVAAVAGVAGFEVPGTIPRTLTQGAEAGNALVAARRSLPTHQAYVWYLGDLVQSPFWVAYPFHRPAARLVNLRAVDEVADTEPDDLVLVATDRLTADLLPADAAAPCRAGLPKTQRFGVMTVSSLDRALRSGPCPAASASSVLRPPIGVGYVPAPEFISP
jgi:hypothetical protein